MSSLYLSLINALFFPASFLLPFSLSWFIVLNAISVSLEHFSCQISFFYTCMWVDFIFCLKLDLEV